MNQATEPGHDGPETPWIVIPYWNSDLGRKTIERPLPPTPAPGSAVLPGAISYLCESINVTGGPSGVFTPGVPTTVAVTVRNYGRGAGLDVVNLDLWWSAPTTDFGSLTQKPAMAQAVDWLGRDGKAQFPPLVKNMTFTTPFNSGPHVCVVVRATVGDPILPSDPAPDGIAVWPSDPTGDRHWGQRNLHTISAGSSGKFHITFSSANSTSKDSRFLIRANQVSGHAMERLAREVRAAPAKAELASIAVRPLLRKQRDQPEDVVAGESEIAVNIRGKHRLQMILEGQLKRPLGAGEFAAFEVVQLKAGEPREHGKRSNGGHRTQSVDRVGSIGVVVFGPQ